MPASEWVWDWTKDALLLRLEAIELVWTIVFCCPAFSNGKNAFVTEKVPTTFIRRVCCSSSRVLHVSRYNDIHSGLEHMHIQAEPYAFAAHVDSICSKGKNAHLWQACTQVQCCVALAADVYMYA